MVEESDDIRIPVLSHILEAGFKSNGDMCICSAGKAKCGNLTSIWTGLPSRVASMKRMDRDDAFSLLRDRDIGLYSQLKTLQDAKILIRKGARSICIKEDDITRVQNAIQQNKISLLIGELIPEAIPEEEEIPETRAEITILPFVRPRLKQERGNHWKVEFSNEFWESVKDVWDRTSNTGREHQLALCLEGEKIIGGNFYVGEAESVEATDRDFICPDHTVKVGALHTHPPDTESLKKQGLSDERIEQTMVQSIPDLQVTIKFNDPIACATSKRSTTCMVNRSDFLPRELFRDLISRGSAQYTNDKNRLMGEMIKRGILKHRKFNEAITVKSPHSIECKSLDQGLECSISSGAARGDTVVSEAPGIHVMGVEKSFTLDEEDNPHHLITPYVAGEASCWNGFDKRIWCDAHESMGEVTMSKKILQPLYEKRVWEILNKEVVEDVERSPLWFLLNNYVTVLKNSSDRLDQDKGSLILGVMSQYTTDKEINKFVSGILSLIQIT